MFVALPIWWSKGRGRWLDARVLVWLLSLIDIAVQGDMLIQKCVSLRLLDIFSRQFALGLIAMLMMRLRG